jgi:phosphoserine aminotransferase
MSVMEVSHRGADFIECAARAEAALRRAARRSRISYRVLFTAGRSDRAVRGRAAEHAPPGATVDYVF